MTSDLLIAALQAVHWFSGLVVLAEALNKLERTAPCRPGLTPRERATDWLKALAWLLLALGAAGALLAPLMPFLPMNRSGAIWPLLMPTQLPTLQDTCIALGFAVLIVRTRVKEG
ncbi:hypothetical protein [Acidovorax sp. sic0104]|uniref:hypothetical protein n=1 Tax=Acidovorax sp. sic0104 TaxID=2854784 RepID=UPI001C43C37D|nr:hypothetical protein [Acidovorax sp. sic0104]MBV7541024.1 hypothetical protein [Acidovorax sp. sic0104]